MATIIEDALASDRIENPPSDPAEIEAMLLGTIHLLEWIDLGLADRRHGLIYFFPLCHDGRELP